MKKSLFSAFTRRTFLNGMAVCVTAAAGIGIFAACDQNFNEPNPNSPSPATATLQTLVTGTLANWRYTEPVEWFGIMGRESYTSASDDPRILQQPILDNLDATAFIVNRPWNNIYFVIGNARNLIDFAKERNLPAEQAAGVEGVAKTIWAHELMRLSNIWYDEGIKIEYKLDLSAPFVPRTQSLAEAAKLLDEANAALSRAGSTFAFKLGNGFTGYDTPAQFARVNRALRARLAAYQGDYAAVSTALAASFLTESNTATDMTRGVYHVYSTDPGDVPPGGRTGGGGNPFFQNINAGTIRWWAHSKFFSDNTDNTVDTRVTRKTAVPGTVPVPAGIGGGTGLTATRALNLYPTNTTPTSIIRNEELLLLRAEARIFGTPKDLAGATADLNRVRQAAGAPALATTLTDANALTQLLYERRYSLFYEGHRWVDLKRFNRFGDIAAERATDKINTKGFPRPVNEIPQQ